MSKIKKSIRDIFQIKTFITHLVFWIVLVFYFQEIFMTPQSASIYMIQHGALRLFFYLIFAYFLIPVSVYAGIKYFLHKKFDFKKFFGFVLVNLILFFVLGLIWFVISLFISSMKQQYVIWFIMLASVIYVSMAYLFILFFHKIYFKKGKYLIKKSFGLIWKWRRCYLYSVLIVILSLISYYFIPNYLIFIIGAALITSLNEIMANI